MAKYEQGNYIVETLSGGRVRVYPKHANVTSIKIGVSNSFFTLGLEDIKNATTPPVFKNVIRDDTGARAGYWFASPLDAYTYGDKPCYETYSGEAITTNADGVKYKTLTDYKKHLLDWEIYEASFDIRLVYHDTGRIMWGNSPQKVIFPSGIFAPEDPIDANSKLFFSDRGTAFYFDRNISGFDVYDLRDINENPSYKASSSESNALIGALNQAIGDLISENYLMREGEVALAVEGYASGNNVLVRLNNGMVLKIVYSQSPQDTKVVYKEVLPYTRAIRITDGNVVEAQAQFCVGSGGELAYGTPSNAPSAFNGSVTTGLSFGGKLTFNGLIAGSGIATSIPTHWCHINNVNVANYNWVQNYLDGYVENYGTDQCGTKLLSIETARYSFSKIAGFGGGVFSSDVSELGMVSTSTKDVLNAGKIPLSQGLANALLATQSGENTKVAQAFKKTLSDHPMHLRQGGADDATGLIVVIQKS
ncbi:MAG: hypothetical protein AB7D43_03185 [Sulfurimonadaceae bacterium]